VNRLGRLRESEILRNIFERVVTACMASGLVKGEGFAVDASVMEADASRYHGKAPRFKTAFTKGVFNEALYRVIVFDHEDDR
jgi:hypothetical protein